MKNSKIIYNMEVMKDGKIINNLVTIKVACDEKCHKARGILNRPFIQLSADENDYAYLADDELDDDEINIPTEGDEIKPKSSKDFPTKWCINQCERCEKFGVDDGIFLMDFSKRIYNIPSKHKYNGKRVVK